ncbi:MAG: hypothetical protein ACLTE2_10380 [Eubacteriales bacterium]
MAMENQELLEALRYIIKEETRAVVKEEIQPINSRLDNMDSRLDNIETDVSEIKNRTLKIEVILENEIRPNIQLLMEGHKGLVDTMHDIKKDTGRIETIETELFATKEVTKDNVQNIKNYKQKEKYKLCKTGT